MDKEIFLNKRCFKSEQMKNEKKILIRGVIESRKCECCGHHEIGVVTEEGQYLPLRSGMKVELIE